MLIEKQQEKSNDGLSEGVMTQDVHDGGNLSSLPPAYTQAVGSTNYAQRNEKWNPEHSDNQDVDYTAPPPHSPSSSSAVPIPAPSNNVHIFKRDGSIRGTWNIHPGLQIPAALVANSPTREDTNYAKGKPWKKDPEDKTPVDAVGPQPNLTLHTRDGRIFGDVWISDSVEQDEAKAKQPTVLDLNTRDGKVTLRLRTHGTRPLDIRIHTNDGPVTVFLPRSFTGLILHDIRDGKLVFSPAMQGMTTTFSAIEGKFGSSFIGDWQTLLNGGEAGIGHWQGDKCKVATKDGSIYFFWEDEYDEVMVSRKSNWFKALYWME